MPFSPTRHRIALVIALVGMAFAVFTEIVHQQMGTGSALGQLCNVSPIFSCDVVINSRWGRFLGLPVAVWGAGAFALGAGLALPGAIGTASPRGADLALLGLSSWNVGFAAVLAFVMIGVIRHGCVFCLTMDTIIVAWFVTVLPLARRIGSPGPTIVAASLLLAVAVGGVAATWTPGAARTVAEIRARDPQFFDEYTKQPVRPLQDVLGDAKRAKGDANAPITVVEFSDFECPACRLAHGVVKSLLQKQPDVRFVFRHFPLDPACNRLIQQPLHDNACRAAAAAECAGDQGRFFEYHDRLFENQPHLDRDNLFRFARELGLDIAAFRTCLDAPATMDRIKTDITVGERTDIRSTPTFFINGRHVGGSLDDTKLEWALLIERDARATTAPSASR